MGSCIKAQRPGRKVQTLGVDHCEEIDRARCHHLLSCSCNPSRIGTVLDIENTQADIVREIFESFARGISYFAIARSLDERGSKSFVEAAGEALPRMGRQCSPS